MLPQMPEVASLRAARWARLGERIGRFDPQWLEELTDALEELVGVEEEDLRLHAKLRDLLDRRIGRKMTG